MTTMRRPAIIRTSSFTRPPSTRAPMPVRLSAARRRRRRRRRLRRSAPPPQSRQQPHHRGRPDRLRDARHRRCLRLPHLRHRVRLQAGAGHHRRQRAEQDRSICRPEVRAGAGPRRRAGDERLVSREEQPVALPGTSSVPRVVFPSPVQPAPTTTGSTPSASNAQASGGSMDQPKRIRTVPIRPEGGDTSARPSDDAPTRAAPPTARTAPVAPPSTRAGRDQPLSLDPAAPAPATEAARPQQRALTPPAPRETAAPAARVAAVAADQRQRQQQWRRLPGAGVVAEKRVGRAGVLPRRCRRNIRSSSRGRRSSGAPISAPKASIIAPWSPFDTGDEAIQFCNGLKQAGGQCIILRN